MRGSRAGGSAARHEAAFHFHATPQCKKNDAIGREFPGAMRRRRSCSCVLGSRRASVVQLVLVLLQISSLRPIAVGASQCR